MNIVLVEPEIPPNTGNVGRLCAATRSTLHLIEPFGFKLEATQAGRAGLLGASGVASMAGLAGVPKGASVGGAFVAD